MKGRTVNPLARRPISESASRLFFSLSFPLIATNFLSALASTLPSPAKNRRALPFVRLPPPLSTASAIHNWATVLQPRRNANYAKRKHTPKAAIKQTEIGT
eukprot:GHVT01061312.1.p2 GENE.GHVT01061312.1~~GHVT01061312.1.p2  ORF type:complete len:101 (+),score=14.30 GHVT01061312.1:130-432(+)